MVRQMVQSALGTHQWLKRHLLVDPPAPKCGPGLESGQSDNLKLTLRSKSWRMPWDSKSRYTCIGSPFQTIQVKIGLFLPPKLIWREDFSRSTRGSKIAKLKLVWSSKMFACTGSNFLKHPGGQSFPT